MRIFITTIITVFYCAFGQAQNVTIGTGTSNSLYGPIYIFSSGSINTHSWNLALYTASELSSSGALPGTISSIGWFKNDNGAYTANDATFEIYIKHVTLNDFNASTGDFDNEVTNATLVYSNTVYSIPNAIGWLDFNFSNSFVWNGTDNIMVLTKWIRVGNATNAVNWASTATGTAKMVSHSFSSTATMGALYTTLNRQNTRFQFPLGTSISAINANKVFDIFVDNTSTLPSIYVLKNKNNYKSYRIVNMMGALVEQGTISEQNQVINVSDLAKGVYIFVADDYYKKFTIH